MKIHRDFYKQSMRAVGIAAVGIFGVLSTLGSGGGGGDSNFSGNPPSSIKAFNFDANNTFTAAQLAATAMSFFPRFTAVRQQIIDTLINSTPGNSPFNLDAICNGTGHAQLSWNDADGSGDLSQGDTLTLLLTGCDLDGSGATVNGNIGFVVSSSVTITSPTAYSIPFTISINLQINDTGSTTAIVGEFGDSLSTSDGNTYTDAFMGDVAANQMLAVTEDGSSFLQFGCFNLTQVGVPNSGTYGLSASGVINASNAILSLASGPQLSFVSDNMESGTKRLLSSSVPDCATLGVPNGVADSDGSYIDMEALGGGNIRLHTFDSTNSEIHTEDTTYNALLN